MKSIVALLALVCVAQAGVILEDGYVGSWFDTMYVEGTTDLTAPTPSGFEYYYLDEGDAETNVTDYYDMLEVDWDSDEDSDNAYYSTCQLSYTLWNDAGDTALNTVACSCSSYSSNYGYCYFNTGIPAGTYMAELITWDWIGNWRVTTSEDDAELMDVVVWNNRVDMMAPTITGMGPDAATDLEIPAANADATNAGAYVEIWISAHDNEADDDNASGLASAGVTLTDSEETMWLALGLDDSEFDADGNYEQTFGYTIQFYNWADEGVWTIDSFDAVDLAGNWATSTAGFDITLTTLVNEVDSGRPPQCDTFGIGDDSYTYYTSSDYNVIMSASNTIGYYATSYVYFNMECNADYAGWNYAGALFASPQVQLMGATGAAAMWAQTEEGVLPPEQMTIGTLGAEDEIYYYNYPGDSLYGAGDLSYWYDAWYVYDGYPVGEYTLDRVYTTTETGAVQVYDSALGSASSVVPSVVVVAAALAAAMFL